jgi:hypothetical protein
MQSLAESWRAAFWEVVQDPQNAELLRRASVEERLRDWTTALTAVAIQTCQRIGWQASAKGHQTDLLPVSRGEYLGLDVMAFTESGKRWRFPTAVFELENGTTDDPVAYSLWKVLSVRADFRAVFCYRRESQDGAALVRMLRDEVVQAMDVKQRAELDGSTVVVVGSRNDSATFPYGFFKWWELDTNTGSFRVM